MRTHKKKEPLLAMSLLGKVYRFALKRLLGPFLVGNELSLDDFEVKLRAKEVHLRNLNLDVVALNAFLELDDVEIVSATIASVQLSFRETLCLNITGINLVVRPAAAHRKPAVATTLQNDQHKDVDGDDNDDVLKKGDETPTTVTESMSFLEVWVDRITTTLKFEVVDVNIRIESGSNGGGNVALRCAIQRATSFNEEQYRKTELFDVSLQVMVNDSEVIELASAPHLLLRTPRSSNNGGEEEEPTLAVELLVKRIAIQCTPRSLQLVQEFYYEALLQRLLSSEDEEEDDDNTLQLLSPSPPPPPTTTKPPMRFTVHAEQVDFALVVDTEQLVCKALGFRMNNDAVSLDRIDFTLANNNNNNGDLWFSLHRPNETEHDVTYTFGDSKLVLAFDLTMGTSMRFSTISTFADAFSPALAASATSSAARAVQAIAPVISTSSTQAEQVTFSLESMSSWRIVLESELNDNVIIELHTIKGNASKLAVESGVIWMKQDDVEAPVFFLEKFLHISIVDDTPPLTTNTVITSSMSESPIEDEEEEESMNIVQAASALQTKAASSGQTIVDISLGGISTPLNLDVALYQRFIAVCLTPVSSSSNVNESSDEPASLPVIVRTMCKSGRLLLGEPSVAVEVAFQDLTTLTFGLDSVVQAEYFVVSEYLHCTTQVPICYASPYSSSSPQQALLAIVTQVSLLQSSIRAQLSSVIFRLEPASTGILRVAETFAPATATAASTAGRPIITTALELVLANCVFDVFPSESPFDEVDSRHRPLSRMMLCCGEIQMHSNLVSQATASLRFDVTSLDAQLYLAKHSTREVDEYRRPQTRRLASNDEYAIQSGFVRVGQWQSTLLFLRFDSETTELEIEMQDGKVMTCPDSFQVLTDLFAYITSTMETSKVEESVAEERASTLQEEESIDLQANSSLSASDLRKHLATAPDSALSAKQLKQRYEAPIHLTPFVIEDYYTFGSLPTVPQHKPQAELPSSRMFPRRRKESDDNDPPPDDWVLFDEDDMDFKQPAAASSNNKRVQSFMPQRAVPPPPPPLPTCNSDGEDDGEDDEEEDTDDDRDIMRNSIMFASVTKMNPTNPAAYTRTPQRETIQLIARDDIDRGARRGIEGYKQLHESMLHIVHDIQERDQQAMASVHDDSEMYRSVMLSNAEPSKLWQPGQALVHEDDEEQAATEEVEESIFDGRYYEENMDGVKIINHHFPLPRVSQPGSFAPPPAALAARMIGETALPSAPMLHRTAAQRGKIRFILRNGNMTWCLFGGTDFAEDDDEEEEEASKPTTTVTTAAAAAAVSLMVIEDHFTYSAAATSTVLFSSALYKPQRSKRDVNRAVECIVKGVSLVVDGFADNSLSLCFAVHDLDMRDEVKTSPFKQVLHYWDSTGEPRWMGADMLRISLDISSQLEYTVKAASLPIRIKLHQDMVDLFCEFAPRAENPDFPSKQSSTASQNIVFNSFDFRALKIKMDYFPKRIELAKLREGKYVELVRLFNYEGMEVALKRAYFTRVNGVEELASLVFNLWAEDMYNKQLLNLLAGVSPGLANIATDMANIVLLPVQVLNKQGAAPAAHEVVRQGGKLAKTMFVEGIGMGNRVASGALNLLDESRTKRVPKSMEEGLVMAGQAMAARAKSAQHTIIAVPLATLRKEGATGAVKSVVRAIPIAVLQPVLGMGEAFEAITVGAQHSLKPAEYLQETTKWKH